MTPTAAYALRRLMTGRDLNGELADLAGPVRRLADHLQALGQDDRPGALACYLALQERAEAERIAAALQAADPDGPPPVDDTEEPATLADLRRLSDETPWTWPGWIPGARIVGLAATEGVGKTRFALDLARRFWHGLPWPDNQPATLPEGTPTLWICSDGQQDDMAETVAAYGLPDEAVILNTPRDDPYGGNTVDEPADLERLERLIVRYQPGLAFVDSLTYATSFDLCEARGVKAIADPLRPIAQRTRVPIVLCLHLSKEGKALGRRIRGVTRTILQLDAPDPDQPERLKLWVERSIARRPPALGVTMGDGGNLYDFNPPSAPDLPRAGRPPEAREKAEQFVRESLTEKNDRIGNELAETWESSGGSRKTFWRAVGALEEAGELTKDGGPGTGKQVILHLIRLDPESDPDRPS